jgi:hypothetical protein
MGVINDRDFASFAPDFSAGLDSDDDHPTKRASVYCLHDVGGHLPPARLLVESARMAAPNSSSLILSKSHFGFGYHQSQPSVSLVSPLSGHSFGGA